MINIELDRKYSTSSGDAHEFNKKEMLILNDVSTSDMANYTCKASNSYGSNSKRILFVPKVNSMISFLTISIIIVFISLMSGALFIYIYFKYQTNKNMKSETILFKIFIKRRRFKRTMLFFLFKRANGRQNDKRFEASETTIYECLPLEPAILHESTTSARSNQQQTSEKESTDPKSKSEKKI